MNTQELNLKRKIDQALRREPADLVIRNVSIYPLTTGECFSGDLAICGDTIVGTESGYEGKTVIDGTGLTAVPGFIDSHVHIESSMVTPLEFERCVLPHGTTTAFCDPHELSNVAGADAVRYFSDAAGRLRMDLFINLSSCVPATGLETSGAILSAEDLTRLKDLPHIWGLGEMMNFPGVLSADPEVLKKLLIRPEHMEGHCPLLSGLELNGYLAAGMQSCHESSSLKEAREKIRKGMQILIREGSVAKNLDSLLPLITPENAPFLAFCTDDRNPLDIEEEGHLDSMIARAIQGGADPLSVYRTASLSPARRFGLSDRGILAPGYKADIVLLSDFEHCQVRHVLKNGKPVGESDSGCSGASVPVPESFLHSVRRGAVCASDFTVRSTVGKTTPVIGVIANSLLTEKREFDLVVKDGIKQPDASRDILKVAVLERYGKTGGIGRGFVQGFGIRSGAIASTVGHDSHNLCVVGTSDEDMAAAVNALIACGGGYAVASGGRVTAQMPLPLGGLLSNCSYREVTHQLREIRAAAKACGCTLPEPFMQLAFLPLPVIPFLKITDYGVVDTATFRILPV